MLTNRNKLFLTVIAFFAMALVPMSAQEIEVPEGYQLVDSLVYVRVADVDSSYVGVNVFGAGVNQSEAIAGSMLKHIETNPARTISGYRVRIFSDSTLALCLLSKNILTLYPLMVRSGFSPMCWINEPARASD